MVAARGVTVLELLLALAIGAALAFMALPAMRDFVATHEATAAVNQLIGTVQFTRSAAITGSTTATLCPSADGERCGLRDTWQAGAIAFEDSDRDGVRSANEPILRRFPALPRGSRTTWRSFRNRSYLSFGASGFTAWQNGHFRYCPASGDPRHIREIVINPAGRVRRAPDRNRDGVVEDTSGRPVTCP
jgi:type IV fimbrial biogenesis protein FimT